MTKTFNWQQVIRILGVLLITEAFFMVITAVVSYIYRGDDFIAIIESAILTVGAGFDGIYIKLSIPLNLSASVGLGFHHLPSAISIATI